MTWTLSEDLGDFVAAAGDFLRSSPVRHTIQLAAVETLHARGLRAFGDAAPLFGWWRPAGGAADGAFMQTPPFPALLTRLPAGTIPALATAIADRGRVLPGVNAEQGAAEAFAAAWGERTGAAARLLRHSRLFRLAEFTPPAPPPGAARVAAAADAALLEAWFAAFQVEVGDAPRNSAAAVKDRLGYGGLTLWEADGTQVSLAGATRAAAGMVRVGPVYTPPAHRGKGYGGAVTAAVTRAALDGGAEQVVLFTDLANPTSNALYPRIGYRPVEDRVMLGFTT
jgi:RimJ/RimL family protein N-acetyltransferase